MDQARLRRAWSGVRSLVRIASHIIGWRSVGIKVWPLQLPRLNRWPSSSWRILILNRRRYGRILKKVIHICGGSGVKLSSLACWGPLTRLMMVIRRRVPVPRLAALLGLLAALTRLILVARRLPRLAGLLGPLVRRIGGLIC